MDPSARIVADGTDAAKPRTQRSRPKPRRYSAEEAHGRFGTPLNAARLSPDGLDLPLPASLSGQQQFQAIPTPPVQPPPSLPVERVLLKDDFAAFLVAFKVSASKERYRDLETWLEEFREKSDAQYREDFNADRVHRWIAKQMEQSEHARYGHEGIGGVTARKKLRGLRQAAKWMIETDRCAKDPLRGLRLPKKDIRRKRRSLLPDDR